MKGFAINKELINKYNYPVPRYTSYPTVPVWSGQLEEEKWATAFRETFEEQNHVNGLSLYIHLPFCESLCTYCGCNKKITTNHSVEEKYIAAIVKEWSIYRKLMYATPVIREIHLGGGTPTFFSPANLEHLVNILTSHSIVHSNHEFSIEGHPNNTTSEHLEILSRLGFRRISYGVQDNDPEVQRIINRIQPLENVKRVTEQARLHGFKSINYDLIYGLPRQTIDSISRTINEITPLKPDRIALYSYAHVPWTSKSQRLFDESDLPQGEEKIKLYLHAKELLIDAGYTDIGMDHFALPHDDLFEAWKNGGLHRNFMGYTTLHSGLQLGLGVSAISDTGRNFAQNEKTLHDYYAAIDNGRLAVKKGYNLTSEDISIRKYILDISCRAETTLNLDDIETLSAYCFPKLNELQDDGLIVWGDNTIKLTEQGRYFIRNVCSAFDQYLNNKGSTIQTFSKAI